MIALGLERGVCSALVYANAGSVVLFVADSGRESREAFGFLLAASKSEPSKWSGVKFRSAKGWEEIETPSGGRIKFFTAGSPNSIRGWNAGHVYLANGSHTERVLECVLPTLATSGGQLHSF